MVEVLCKGEDRDVHSVAVRPTTGTVLAFTQDLYHEGAALLTGRKYVLRTEVMYKKVPETQRGTRSALWLAMHS